MTEFLLRSITKGKFEEWHPESFSSLAAVCEQVEDWGNRTGDDVPELMEVFEFSRAVSLSRIVDGVAFRDVTQEVRDLLKQHDIVRMEKEYRKDDNERNYSFETFCELNARY